MLKADHVYRYQMMRIRIALPETIVSAMRIRTVQDIVAAAIVTVSIDFDSFFHTASSIISFRFVPFGFGYGVLCTFIFTYLHLIIINYANRFGTSRYLNTICHFVYSRQIRNEIEQKTHAKRISISLSYNVYSLYEYQTPNTTWTLNIEQFVNF